MDVICLSSDSENSNSSADTLIYSKPISAEDDAFLLDWNDEGYPLAINKSETLENNDALTTPSKSFKAPAQNDLMVVNAEMELSSPTYNISEIISPKSNPKDIESPKISSCKENLSFYDIDSSPKRMQPVLTQTNKKLTKPLRDQKNLNKQKLREEKKAKDQREKNLKAIFATNQRNLKPEENIKFLKVHIDTEIINSVFGGNIILLLQQNNIQYAVESQKKNCTIIWDKKKIIKELDSLDNIIETLECNEEKELIYVIEWDKAVRLIHSNEILTHVETVKSVYPEKRLTLIIYGLQKYFDFHKKTKKANGKIPKLTDFERAYCDAPRISKDQLEFALTDLQIFGKCNVRLLESPEELSGLILNFTKSLSQLDQKYEKQKREEDNFDWFAKGGSVQTVKIDKDGRGLVNLWQQQICQFSAVGLETAQAIVAQYNSPTALVNKYENCESVEQGERLLENIQIRRDLGLLSSTRRVGPQLSKKIFKFFTSDDPNEEL